MAKGNVLLGMARGSIGDVVLYRRDGEQVSRSRNRKPSNPQSNPQTYQRAIMATILQAYSAGKVIFDHSFQNKKVTEGNMREFMSRNLRKLRSEIIAGNPMARVVAPKVSFPVANEYIVSYGTLAQTPFGQALNTLVGGTQGMDQGLAFAQPSDNDETWAEYAARVDLVPEDIYTIVCFGVNQDEPLSDPDFGTDGTQYATQFGYWQLRVKSWDAIVGSTPAGNLTLGDVFDMYANNVNIDDVKGLGITDFDGSSLYSRIRAVNIVGDGYNYGSIGTIRSRDNDGARSYTTLQMMGGDEFGITPDNLIAVWKAAGTLGDSDLILEGSNFERGGRAPLTTASIVLEQSKAESSPTYGYWLAFLIVTEGSTIKRYIIGDSVQPTDPDAHFAIKYYSLTGDINDETDIRFLNSIYATGVVQEASSYESWLELMNEQPSWSLTGYISATQAVAMVEGWNIAPKGPSAYFQIVKARHAANTYFLASDENLILTADQTWVILFRNNAFVAANYRDYMQDWQEIGSDDFVLRNSDLSATFELGDLNIVMRFQSASAGSAVTLTPQVVAYTPEV